MPSSFKEGYPFSTPAKDYVRQEMDRKVIERFQQEHFPDCELSYLGLPGRELLDVLALREFVGAWTGVQIVDTAQGIDEVEQLELNVLRNRLERDFSFIQANIDDLL